MTEWRVLLEVKPFMLQTHLTELTLGEWEIEQIIHIPPFAVGHAVQGNVFTIVAVKYG